MMAEFYFAALATDSLSHLTEILNAIVIEAIVNAVSNTQAYPILLSC